MTNTERPTTKDEKKKNLVMNVPKEKKLKVETPKTENTASEEKTEIKKPEEKKDTTKKSQPIIKKSKAEVNSVSVPVSSKISFNVCNFIRGKKIDRAIEDLEQVSALKKVVPMRGEYAHKKGKGIMAGRYPKRTAEQFIVLLKHLKANSIRCGLEDPVVSEAIANFAPRPRGRFGRVQRKRTHIRFVARDKKINKKQKDKKA